MLKRYLLYVFIAIIFFTISFNYSLQAENTSILEAGAKGEKVKKIQNSLKELNYFSGKTDGIFGEKTIKAVVEFQKKANLTADGKVGPGTKKALKTVQGETEISQELKVYTRSPEVLYVQRKLKQMGIYSGFVDGIYGPKVREAVKSFQKQKNLKETGIVGEKTWNLLREKGDVTKDIKKDVKKSVKKDVKKDKSSKKEKYPLLEIGDRNEAVKRLQKLLKEAGFNPVSIDGIFGYQTKLTLKLFQQFHGLRIDGVAGPQTWKVLTNSNHNNNSGIYQVRPGDTLWDLAQKWDLSLNTLKKYNNLHQPKNLKAGQKIKIPGKISSKKINSLSWNRVNNMFPEDTVIMITEIQTGLTLRVKRLYGSNHADVEPLTPRDTQILKRIYGGKWNWERRAVVVHLDGVHLAGSINGNPHGDFSIHDNNFQGHICLHFKGSTLHKNGKMDEAHQQQIRKSASQTWPLGKP